MKMIILILFASALSYGREDLDVGREFIERGDCPSAKRLLFPLVQNNAVSVKALALINQCLTKEQDYTELIAFNSNYLKKFPLTIDAELALVQTYQTQGNLQAALIHSENLLLNHPDSETAVYQRAKILMANNDAPSAEKVLNSFAISHKSAYQVKLLLAKALLQNQELKLAEKQVRDIKAAGPITDELYRVSGLIQKELGNYRGAFSDLQYAARLDVKKPENYVELSRLHSQMGNALDAIETLYTAMENVNEGGQSTIIEELARVQMTQGYFRTARQTLKQIKDKISESRWVYWNAKSYLFENKFPEASTLLKKHLGKHPSDSWAQQAYERISNPEKRVIASVQKTIAVKAGDSLSSLAKRHLGSSQLWKKLFSLNKRVIKDPNLLNIGMIITLCEDDLCSE